MADSELAAKLSRRQMLNEEEEEEEKKNEHKTEEEEIFEQESGQEISESACDELKNRLTRRQDINEGKNVSPAMMVQGRSVYAEFTEFTRKQIKSFQATFAKYDENGDGFIDFEELKRMMENLDSPQTHLALKEMIRLVDEDGDNKINLREFLLIFRKFAAGELAEDSGLSVLANLASVDVGKEGVGGAKQFFEAKIDQLSKKSALEEEIKAEQEEKKKEEEEKRKRRDKFKENRQIFQ